MTDTKAQVNAGVQTILALAEAIRALGSVPSGHLYARVMGHMTLDAYETYIRLLVRTNLVKRSDSHLLTWTGPNLEEK